MLRQRKNGERAWQRPAAELLESRRLFSHPAAMPEPENAAQNADAASLVVLANAQSNAKFPLSDVPALSSDPGAPVAIYLDFVGTLSTMIWEGHSVPIIPAYDQDGDPTTFSTSELTSINEIWQVVSESYSPFNINVTTVPPASLVHGQNLELIIGGDDTWVINDGLASSSAGGISYTGAFASPSLPNISFVFPAELSSGYPKYTGEAAAHEAGHEFGLSHQSVWLGTTLEAEYNTGTSDNGPIMGDPYGDSRALWYDGTTDYLSNGEPAIQNDMATIASNTNGITYRDDGISHSITSPTIMSPSESGIISSTNQVDYYQFTTAGGSVPITASQFSIPSVYDGMLKLKFSLYSSTDNLLDSSVSGLSETIDPTLAAGTYTLAISSDGAYGDVGQYTLSVSAIAPAAPTSPGVSVTSSTAVHLSWTDSANDAAGYDIESSLDDSTWLQIGSTDSTSFDVTGLNSSTTYYYRIRAYNTAGDSGYTSAISATTAISSPAAPTALNALRTSASEIALTWTDNSNNETGFYIDRSTDDANWSQIDAAPAGTTSYPDANLQPNTTYYYRVAAYNDGGESAYTNISSSTTLPLAPAAPSNPTATAVGSSEIDLSWTDNSNQTSFSVERSLDDSTWSPPITTSLPNYSDTGLNPDTTYYYRVFASNTGGDSADSSEFSATTFQTIPTAPSNLQAALSSGTALTLTWQDNSDNESGFDVDRSTDDANWTSIGQVGANITTLPDSDLAPQTEYYYRVTAFNSAGDSPYADTSITTPEAPPVAPSTPVATAVSTTEIDLTWSDNSDQDGFYLERSTDDSTWSQITAPTSGNYQDINLSPATTYYYRLRAYNAGGDSAYTTPISATTLTAAAATETASQLVITQQPSAATAGSDLGSFVVALEDADGNVVTGNHSSVSVSLANNAANASLGGTLSVAAENGVATFTDLNLLAAGSYTLTVSDGALPAVTSEPFTVSPGAAATLQFLSQPVDDSAGVALPAISVAVQDQFGNTITADASSITLSSSPGGAGAIASIQNGIATFNGLSFTKSGTYNFTAADGTLPSATSGSFTIFPAAASTLSITQQPDSALANQSLSPLSVQVADQFGNPIDQADVTVALANNLTGAMLNGATSLPTTDGSATFSNLSVNRAGNYNLSVSVAGLPAVVSNPFTITYPSPQLVFSSEPTNIPAGGKLPAITIDTDDAAGDPLPTAKAKVLLSLSTAGKLIGTTSATVKGGHAVFSKLSIQKAGTYTIQAAAAGFGSASSSTFTVTPGAPAKLIFSSQPGNIPAGTPFDISISAVDHYSNPAANSNLMLALGAHPTGASLSVSSPITDGLANFSNLTLTDPGNYTLFATDGKLKATSKKFRVL